MGSKSQILVSITNKTLKGTIQLTGSKSESNRALIMQALSGGKVAVENLSKAVDTVTLGEVLSSQFSVGRSQVAVDSSQLAVGSPQLADLKSIPDSNLKSPDNSQLSDLKIQEVTGIGYQVSGNSSQLSDLKSQISNLQSQDTSQLSALSSQPSNLKSQIDVGPAGTAMRFLTAYATLQPGETILTGSERMQQRPIGILVDALRQLGARIEYENKEGFPPLKISGPLTQTTSLITIKGNISSQYISALLLIAPKLPLGLELQIEGELTSTPYVEMTLAMLEQAGIRHGSLTPRPLQKIGSFWDEKTITIEPQEFSQSLITIEPDWSAASYWYAIAALSDQANFFLPGLNAYSLQGDSRITEIMANFGITSQFKDGGVYLEKEPKKLERKIFDFKDCPDLAQTVIVCCAALGHDATFTGLETLKIKETDRIKALQTELEKIGVKLIEKNLTCKLDCSGLHFPEKISINTYEDHRMAMAFVPLALKINEVEIDDARVVDKSYPHFWDDLVSVGFKI